MHLRHFWLLSSVSMGLDLPRFNEADKPSFKID